MEELNLELNHTYLLRYGNSSIVSSATILLITDKAYRIRWNNGLNSNDVWELKTELNGRYSVVEDISDFMNELEVKEVINPLNIQTTWKDCPECQGKGWFPDSRNTAGRTICTNCYGSRKVIDIVKVF